MVIKIACCKGCNTLIVERVRRSRSGLDDVSFVKLELYFAGYILLGVYDLFQRYSHKERSGAKGYSRNRIGT